MSDLARPEHVAPEPRDERLPDSDAPVRVTEAGRVLELQRTAGNRAVGQLLARRGKPQTRLERLDEMLGKFNVDEDGVIAHLATLDAAEKAVVIRDYRARIASPLNVGEMVRAVKILDPPLATKLSWVSVAGSPSYSDIKRLIIDPAVPQAERSALATDSWRQWFVRVCTNATMKEAVVDLGFILPNKLAFIASEMSADYDDIKGFIRAPGVQDFERERLKTPVWRKWFVDVCNNRTMRDAVVDLRFDVATKIDWMVDEGTDVDLLRSALRQSRRPEVAALVGDLPLLTRVRSATGAAGVRMVDQVQVELAKGDVMAAFAGAVDVIPETRLHNLRETGSWLPGVATLLGDERFSYLAARIMLVTRYAPAARGEALRVLTSMLRDSETAIRMIRQPVQAVIVPRDKMMTELAEFRKLLTSDSGGGPGNTFDGRPWKHVRGVGNVEVDGVTYAALTEENLLGGLPDARVFPTGVTPAGYAVGYSTVTHEFAHVLHHNGLSSAEKKLISKHYNQKRKDTRSKAGLTLANVWPDGPRVSPTAPPDWVAAGWTDARWLDTVALIADDSRRVYENYSSQNESEYFAQLSNAYLGTNLGTDPTTGQPRNNGRAWIVANEQKEMLDLLDKVYKNRTVNDIDAAGALTAGGLCTNPNPAPPPPPPGPPPAGPAPGGTGP